MARITFAAIPSQAYANRITDVPDADWAQGCNAGGLNAPGIGVNMEGGEISGQLQQFTLLDQAGNTRVPQNSSGIGFDPVDLTAGDNADDGKGGVFATGEANLQTLAAGWVPTAV